MAWIRSVFGEKSEQTTEQVESNDDGDEETNPKAFSITKKYR